MLRKLGFALLALGGVFAVAISIRPAHFSIARSAAVHAPADVVYGFVSDLHQLALWSPWAKLDPGMVGSFGGPAAGVGQSYTWKGNSEVGEGTMTLKELKPPEAVGITLDLRSPLTATDLTELKLAPTAEGVTVTWILTGDRDFMGKAFDLFLDLDQRVGADFERGLAHLAALAEAEVKRRAAAEGPAPR